MLKSYSWRVGTCVQQALYELKRQWYTVWFAKLLQFHMHWEAVFCFVFWVFFLTFNFFTLINHSVNVHQQITAHKQFNWKWKTKSILRQPKKNALEAKFLALKKIGSINLNASVCMYTDQHQQEALNNKTTVGSNWFMQNGTVNTYSYASQTYVKTKQTPLWYLEHISWCCLQQKNGWSYLQQSQ